MSEAKKYYKDELPCRSPYTHKISNLSANMVDHAFLTLVHNSVEPQYKNYIQLEPIDVSHFNLPEKYVVITTGFTSLSREWKAQSVNEVAEYCISKGYTPVYLGKSYTPANQTEAIIGNFKANYDNGVNLIDKTNLFEAHSIMNSAAATIGLDNGLLHLCGMGSGKSIWGFTTVLPEHRLPYKDGIQGKDCLVVIPTEEELKCIGCQSKMNFAPTTHNFTGCYYKDFACLELMTSDKWIIQLEKLGI